MLKNTKRVMSSKKCIWAIAMLLAAGLSAGAASALAQSSQSGPGSQSQSGQQPSTTSKPQSPAASSNTIEIPTSRPPVSAEEEAAEKAFLSLPNTDLPKKIAAGEEFLKKYPESAYRPVIYSALTFDYLQNGDTGKAFDVGDKEIALKPDDVQTLAVLSQTLPRAITANTSEPEKEKQLAKAEDYGKRAIEITPTITKPEGVPEQNFNAAKNTTLAMAHSGLGLVYFRRGKFNDAIPELEQSVKIDPNPTPDPVNLYVLAMASQKTSHFDEAVAAFTKCAAIAGKLQSVCKNGADEAKKQGATQLSSPK
jgi:tetratricopeptide (TPR) repeat protein